MFKPKLNIPNQSKPSTIFSIVYQNIEGFHGPLGCKIENIKSKVKADITFFSETWSCDHDKDISGYSHIFNDGYKLPNCNKGRSSGGLILYFKKHLHEKINVLKSTPYVIWLEVDKSLFPHINENVFICATYVPPANSKYSHIYTFYDIAQDIMNFCDDDAPLIFLGDLNARTGQIPDNLDISNHENDIFRIKSSQFIPRENSDPADNSRGYAVSGLCKSFNLRILNGRFPGDSMGNFTCFKNNHPSTVDYAIASNNLLGKIDNFTVFPQSEYSDHSQITVQIHSSNLHTETDNLDKGWYDLSRPYKWDLEALEVLTDVLNDTESTDMTNRVTQHMDNGLIDDAGDLITSVFIRAASKSSLNNKISYMGKSTANKPKRILSKKWFDKDLKDQRMLVRRMARHKHRTPLNKDVHERHDQLLKEYKKQCRHKRYKYFQDTFGKLESDLANPECFWKEFKNSNEKISSKNTLTSAISSREWEGHFHQLHTEVREGDVPELPENKPTPVLNDDFQLKELIDLKKSLKKKKSGGLAQITNEMILCAPDSLLKVILDFFNLCLREGYVPSTWCHSLICPIYKDGPKSNPDNYRGICISNSLLKLLCLLLNKRLQDFTDKNDILAKEQIGFKKNARTSDHIYTLKTLITKHTQGKTGQKVFACFVDLKKAYDSVWNKGLFAELIKKDINGNFLTLIKNIYFKTKCAVKVNGRRTEFFDYTKGVRQGCPLSPILFNIYINDIITSLNRVNPTPLSLSDYQISSLLYADDLVIVSTSKEGLQKCLDELHTFCTDRKLEVNLSKTKCITFSRRGDREKHLFTLNNIPIVNADSYKYLGVTFGRKNASLNKTIDDLSVKANKAMHALHNKFKMTNMPIKVFFKIFDTMIVPILLYCSEIWNTFSGFDARKWDSCEVEKQHTQMIKRCLGVNRSTTNNMVRAEVGRTPLQIQALCRTWSYIKYITDKNDTELVKKAYEFELSNADPNFKLGLSTVGNDIRKTICNVTKTTENVTNISKTRVKKILVNDYIAKWKVDLPSISKARTFALHKTSYNFEPYLDLVKIRRHRVALSKLRLSDHSLMIEVGRHRRPKLELGERTCNICPNIIEDETHFLVTCITHNYHRTFIDSVSHNNPAYTDMNDQEKYGFIVNTKDPVHLSSTAYTVHTLFKDRVSNLR